MVSIREDPLIDGMYYHIYSRSIAGYIVFDDEFEFGRFLQLIDLYRYRDFDFPFSKFNSLGVVSQSSIISATRESNDVFVEIVAFCIMPTHIHLILKQIRDDGVTRFMGKVLNSYSKFFNARHKRQGPLWSGRFKNVLVGNDEQLLHLTRYIHLNPTSAGLVQKPEDWEYSSYREYIGAQNIKNPICNYENLFDLSGKQYKKFVNDRKSYQRDLALIENTLIDNYTG